MRQPTALRAPLRTTTPAPAASQCTAARKRGGTSDPPCNFAYVEFQRCQRAAKTGVAHAACTMAYINNGGMSAAGFVGCTLTNCSTVCG